MMVLCVLGTSRLLYYDQEEVEDIDMAQRCYVTEAGKTKE